MGLPPDAAGCAACGLCPFRGPALPLGKAGLGWTRRTQGRRPSLRAQSAARSAGRAGFGREGTGAQGPMRRARAARGAPPRPKRGAQCGGRGQCCRRARRPEAARALTTEHWFQGGTKARPGLSPNLYTKNRRGRHRRARARGSKRARAPAGAAGVEAASTHKRRGMQLIGRGGPPNAQPLNAQARNTQGPLPPKRGARSTKPSHRIHTAPLAHSTAAWRRLLAAGASESRRPAGGARSAAPSGAPRAAKGSGQRRPLPRGAQRRPPRRGAFYSSTGLVVPPGGAESFGFPPQNANGRARGCSSSRGRARSDLRSPFSQSQISDLRSNGARRVGPSVGKRGKANHAMPGSQFQFSRAANQHRSQPCRACAGGPRPTSRRRCSRRVVLTPAARRSRAPARAPRRLRKAGALSHASCTLLTPAAHSCKPAHASCAAYAVCTPALLPPRAHAHASCTRFSRMRKRRSLGTDHTNPTRAPPVTSGLALGLNSSSSPSTHLGGGEGVCSECVGSQVGKQQQGVRRGPCEATR